MAKYDDARSPEVNIALALFAIATELKRLGNNDADTRMGAIEGLGDMLHKGMKLMSDSIDGFSDTLKIYGPQIGTDQGDDLHE